MGAKQSKPQLPEDLKRLIEAIEGMINILEHHACEYITCGVRGCEFSTLLRRQQEIEKLSWSLAECRLRLSDFNSDCRIN
jgi:hypothetical protein